MIGAQKNARDVLLNIEEFGVLNEYQQFELAKLCAMQDGENTALFILQFDELAKTKRFEVLKICAQHDGFGASQWVGQRDLGLSKEQVKKLLGICAQGSSPRIAKPFELSRVTRRDNLKYDNVEKFLEKIFRFGFSFSHEMHELKSSIGNLPHKLLDDAYEWLFSALHCDFTFEKHEKTWVHGRELFSHLLVLPNPLLRQTLTNSLLEMPLSEESLQGMDKIFSPNSTLAKAFPLLAIPFAQLFEMGVSKEVINNAIEHLTHSLENPDSRLKDGNVQETLLKHLSELVVNKELSKDEKTALFTKITNESATPSQNGETFEKVFRMNLVAFSGMVIFNDLQRIREGVQGTKSLREFFSESFQAHIPIKKLDRFLERYEEIFGQCRNPDALVVLAMKLKEADKRAIESVCGYIETVISGTFLEKRYGINKRYNEHLFKLFNGKEELLKTWQKREEIPLDEMNIPAGSTPFKAEVTDDPLDLLLGLGEVFSHTLFNKKLYEQTQDINGEGLLGHLLNGKYLLACVKDAQGKVVTGSLLSLSFLTNGEPILLKLGTLPHPTLKAYEEALEKLTETKANELKCSIATTSGDRRKGKPLGENLVSLPGPTYDYKWSGIDGGLQNGNYRYTIADCHAWKEKV